MRYVFLSACALIASTFTVLAGDTKWTCLDGNRISIQRQGNTETRSCLDDLGKPHGPFEVWAWPDSVLTKPAILLLRGRFDHGDRKGEWVSFSEKGSMLESGEFLKNRKAKPTRDKEKQEATGNVGDDK